MNIVFSVFILLACVSVAVVASLLWARKKAQAYISGFYKVQDPKGIEILESTDIGGVQQWFHARGRKQSNPILLYIHGGPGAPHIGISDAMQRPWENHFTVVQWDQRQAGKSYAPNIGHTISHEQYINDAEAMVAFLRDRFNVEKIFIMGTSYGTYLGMHMVKRRPEWIYAYIGVGQVVTMADHARAEYELLLEYAKNTDNNALVDKLERLAPYPNPKDPAISFLENAVDFMAEESRMGKCYPMDFKELGANIVNAKWASPHYTLRDHLNRLYGDTPAPADPKNPFFKKFYDFDLPNEIGSTFDCPAFFFTGIDDFHVAYTVTDSWFKKIQAPHKEQIWFNESAHAAMLTEPYAFANALIEKVLPLSKGKTH